MKRLYAVIVAFFALFLVAGCADRPRTVEKPDDMLTSYDIDIQDYDRAAAEIKDRILASGKLRTDGQRPTVLFVSRFVNNTGDPTLDISTLTDKIVAELNAAGKIEASSDDPVAQQLADESRFLNPGSSGPTADAGYTLTGKITRIDRADGRKHQVTYIFHLNLNSAATGTAVWSGQAQMTKRGERAGLGL